MNLRCGVPRLLVKSIDVPLHEAFFVATICCNVIATGLISARLILHRRSLLAIGLSERPSFTNYSTFASIFADSAALYALVGIIYLPIYFEQLPVQAVFSSLFAALTVGICALDRSGQR
jgi:F0F1-type ATP synthase membrane subunit c/vacuolar-type H+-ATPase subunit K